MLKHTKQQRIIAVAAAACVMVIEHLVIWQKPLFLFPTHIHKRKHKSRDWKRRRRKGKGKTLCVRALVCFSPLRRETISYSPRILRRRPLAASHQARGKRRVMVIAFFLSCSKGKQSKTEDPKWFFRSSLLVVLFWIPRLRTSLAHILRKKAEEEVFVPLPPPPNRLLIPPPPPLFGRREFIRWLDTVSPSQAWKEGKGKGLAGGGGS